MCTSGVEQSSKGARAQRPYLRTFGARRLLDAMPNKVQAVADTLPAILPHALKPECGQLRAPWDAQGAKRHSEREEAIDTTGTSAHLLRRHRPSSIETQHACPALGISAYNCRRCAAYTCSVLPRLTEIECVGWCPPVHSSAALNSDECCTAEPLIWPPCTIIFFLPHPCDAPPGGGGRWWRLEGNTRNISPVLATVANTTAATLY